MPTSLKYALKEWAIAIRALETGATILLLRKGGIREVSGRFEVQNRSCLLYPTYEHQKPHLLKPAYAESVTTVASGWHPSTVSIRSWAEITEIFCVSEESVVKQLLAHHIWNEQWVSERFGWKPRQPLYLLLLRTYKLSQPQSIPYRQEYGGCKSWLELETEISTAASVPVLSQAEYAKQVEAIGQIVDKQHQSKDWATR